MFGLKLDMEKADSFLGYSNRSELVKFETFFMLEKPATQRSVLQFCNEALRRWRSLGLVRSHCWIRDFRTWIETLGHRFPLEPSMFRFLVKEFLNKKVDPDREDSTWEDSFWLQQDSKPGGVRVAATSVSFFLNVSTKAGEKEAARYR